MTQAAPAGWYPDPADPTQQRYWDGVAWTQQVAPTSPSGDAPQNLVSPYSTAQSVVDAPVLQTWKTSLGFSVLGLLLGTPLMMILAFPLAILPMMLFAMVTGASSPQSFSPILALVGNALMLGYAVKIYPSYFSEKPRLKSSKLISFANFMFGGLIFGLLWNDNLTKKTKGISYKVQAWLSGLMCLWLALGIVVALFTSGASSPTESPSGLPPTQVPPTIERNVQALERIEGERIYTDAETGASFAIPSTWTELPLSKERVFLDTKFAASDKAYTAYGSVDLWSVLPEQETRGKTREDFASMNDVREKLYEMMGSSGPYETAQNEAGQTAIAGAQYIVLNGVEYLALHSESTNSKGVELGTVTLARVENGYLYQFQYMSTPAELEGGFEDEDLRTFYSMIASLDYP
jgi:hypothetical protein